MLLLTALGAGDADLERIVYPRYLKMQVIDLG